MDGSTGCTLIFLIGVPYSLVKPAKPCLDSDVNFLQSCLYSLSPSPSLQELDVYCIASSEFWVSFSECCGLYS